MEDGPILIFEYCPSIFSSILFLQIFQIPLTQTALGKKGFYILFHQIVKSLLQLNPPGE